MCLKLQVIFKSQNKSCSNFSFKDPVPQILASGLIYKFQCDYVINPITEIVLDILL